MSFKYQNEITLNKDVDFKLEFKSKPLDFRINAVIHDGQWYDIKKWAKVSMCKVEDIHKFIEENENILITKNDSYRVDYDEVLKWYKENNLSLTENIVPNNFTPKLWAGKTETEHFELTPKRIISSVIVTCKNNDVLHKVRSIVHGYGRIQHTHGDRYNIYTSNCFFVKDRILSSLTEEEKKYISVRTRSNFKWRELSDFSEEFLSEALRFYVVYALGILKPHQKTLDIFLPNREDQTSQIYDWVMTAMQKFDEEAAVPFPGYLSNVLSKWPYDLPDLFLGRELAKFQRDRNRALTRLMQEDGQEIFEDEIIAQEMNYEIEFFKEMKKADEQWNAFNKIQKLEWEDNGNEKSSISVFEEESSSSHSDPVFSNKLSLSILEAANETKDFLSFYNIISQFGGEIDMSKLKVSDEFKDSLRTHLF